MSKKYICPTCNKKYDSPGLCEIDRTHLITYVEPNKKDLRAKYIHNHDPHLHNHDPHIHNHNPHLHSQLHSTHHKHMISDFKKRFIISSIITIPILLLSPFIQSFLGYSISFLGDKYLLFALGSFIFFYGGAPFFKGAKKELLDKNPGMMTLIVLAISVAYIYSSSVVLGLKGKYFFWELATLIDLMLLGHWIEMKSILGASKALEELARLMPNTAHLIKDNQIVDINISQLNKGDILLVKAGEKIPSDGIVIKGTSYIDESLLTGESIPIKKQPNSKVIAGSLNGDGILEIKVTATGDDSYLKKVINLVAQAQATKSKTQRLADKAAFWLTLIAISVGLTTFIYWIFAGKDIAFAIERMVTVMVITCPHALGLAIPLVTAVSTSKAAKNGLLIRNRTAFENARKISIMVFDKTGTLTKGKFAVSSVVPFNNDYNKEDILKLASSLEKLSEHPISKGILEEAKKLNIQLSNVSNFKVLKGEGVKGNINGQIVELISLTALNKRGISLPIDFQLPKASTLVWVLLNDSLIGFISLSDQIKEESYQAIADLKYMGIKCWMLTGDNKEIAEQVSHELGLDGFYAQVLPHEKQEKIKELQANNTIVAMAGDGINDAPALAQADVGIAIGSGTDTAAETGDIILVKSDPRDIVSLIHFGKATYKKMIQNLLWATGYNVITIPLGAGVLYNYGFVLSPAIGAILMSLSTIIVAINATFLNVKKI